MKHQTAFAIPELLVTSAVLPAVLCVGFVATSGLEEGVGISISQSNLIRLGAAHEMYSIEHDGQVFSLSPDDYGAYDGCADYIANRGCLDSLLLGWGESVAGSCDCSAHWGYWVDFNNVCQGVGSCGNAALIVPIDFSSAFGSFRYPNCEQFHSYLNGRFYDSAFYAPLDTLTYEKAEPLIDACCGFTFEGSIVNSSYSFSPSAMWDPGVMRSNADGGFQSPGSYDESHRAPQVSQASYPELKTLLFEHNWNHGQPGPFNPLFAGENTPYYFNHGRDATPLTCFFDGSVRMLRTGNVEADDARVLEETGTDGLWHRGTPLGTDGYYSAQSHDGVRVSHNILTTDGIRGRDILTTSMRSTDANGDGRVDGEDLLGVLGDWGVDTGWNSPHDVNADGLVDGYDLNAVLGTWGD
jgi:hypothetical protein